MDQSKQVRYSAYDSAMQFEPFNPWKAADTTALNQLIKVTMRKEYEDYLEQRKRILALFPPKPKRQKT